MMEIERQGDSIISRILLIGGFASQVLNKYYPPDFDPELIPRNKKPRDRQIEVSKPRIICNNAIRSMPCTMYPAFSYTC
jgi:hypothetical protein